MARNLVLQKVRTYVIKIFNEKGLDEKVYHGLTHTMEVAAECKKLGRASGLSELDVEIVTIAGWFHDLGHIEIEKGHEEKSVEFAIQFLREIEYPEENIEKVVGCIRATKVPQNPQNELEYVICDADLHHIGTKDFFDKNELFKIELEAIGGEKFSEAAWLQGSIDFFSQQKFYTEFARENYTREKLNNIFRMQTRLEELKNS